MKVQFIYPPSHINPSSLTAMRPAAPLGLAYIMAAVRNIGHEIYFIDALAEAPRQYEMDGVLRRIGLNNGQIIERIHPAVDVICITNMWTYAWPSVRQMITEIKQAYPDKLIICGGEHFTGLPELSMQQAPIDFIVLGEGEEIIIQLLEGLEKNIAFDPSTMLGIAWRRGNNFTVNERASRVKNIDDIVWPAWDLVKIDVYNENNYVLGTPFGKTIPILATRGCPYQCTYCASPKMWTTAWYARDYKDVLDEIEYYVKTYGADHFPFQDLTMIIKKQWIIDFTQELLRRNLNIKWQLPVGTRSEVIDREVATLLLKSGCKTIIYAPETGSDSLRKIIKKMMKTENLMRSVRDTIDAGLSLGIFLVIGFPEDTEEDLKQTVMLARELGRLGAIDVACPFYFPIPATEMYDKLMAKGRIDLSDKSLMAPMFCHYMVMTDENNYCDSVSSGRLTFYKYWIVANFYFSQWFWHPSRLFRTIVNVMIGREESKMDTFLNEKKREIFSRINFWSKRSKV